MKTKNTVTVQFEITDILGGEANYAWIRRHSETFPADISDRALVRRAKKWAGYTGQHCAVNNYGEMIEIRPSGDCVVIFVTWE